MNPVRAARNLWRAALPAPIRRLAAPVLNYCPQCQTF